MRKPLSATLILILAVLWLAPPARAAALDRYFASAGIHAVTLETDEGYLHVVSADQDEVHLTVGGARNGAELRPLGDVELSEKWEGETLHLKLTFRHAPVIFAIWMDERIELSLPPGIRLNANVEDGDIDARDLNGGASLSTREGTIHLERAEGAIALTTTGGTAFARDLVGSLDARTGSGKIDAAGRFRRVRASAVDGAIEVSALAGSAAPVDSADMHGWLLRVSPNLR